MSKMRKCKDCGAEISKSAKTCPNCGKNLKTHIVRNVFLVVILIGIIAVIVSPKENDSALTGTDIVQNQEKMTLEKFNKIETGMTYQEVVDIIGEEGTLSTESSYGNQTMQIYYWYASNGISNATVSFQNGKVTAKSQIGLE